MNIYQIQQDLLAIFDELEENGGELTPELEEELSITQEDFKNKVESYTDAIKNLEADMAAIKVEQARLKTLYERKEKTANKLKEIIINAVNEFGDTKKSGVKYLDYGTGEVSVRKTQAVSVNDSLVKEIELRLANEAQYNKEINQLDVCDHIDILGLATDYNMGNKVEVTENELNHIDVNLSVTLPLKDLATGKGYPALREIVKYSDFYKLSTSVSKSAIKSDLKENGSCMPNLAKLSNNESLTIK